MTIIANTGLTLPLAATNMLQETPSAGNLLTHWAATPFPADRFKYAKALANEFSAVISVDTETTHLLPVADRRAWQAGYAYCILDDDQLVISKAQATMGIPQDFWDQPTFQWMRTQPRLSDMYDQSLKLAPSLYLGETVKRVLTNLRSLKSILAVSEPDKKILLVINHPEFDMPLFDAVVPGCLTQLVGHRNVVDLQSVLLGRLGSQEVVRDYLKQFGAAQHVAADDAEFSILALLGMKF